MNNYREPENTQMYNIPVIPMVFVIILLKNPAVS